MQLFRGLVVSATVFAAAVSAFGQATTQSQPQYEAQLNSQLDQFNQSLQAQPKAPLYFAGNLFLAHGSAVKFFPVEVLIAYVNGLRDAGVQRIDINPGTAVWGQTDADSQQILAKYDAVVAHIRKLGLQLAINPEFNAGELSITRFEQFQEAAVRAWGIMAQRYQPEVFILIHEPTTMGRRMGIQTTPQQWLGFVQQTAAAVKRVSPRSRLGAGGLWSEIEYYRLFATVPELALLPVNIYTLDQMPVYSQMVQIAKAAGKAVFVEETWRLPYVPQSSGSLEQFIATGIGDAAFSALDAKWLETITNYAATQSMEAVSPFWTQAFFAYVSGLASSGANSSSGLDYTYNLRVADAVTRGQLTSTGTNFKKLSGQLGRKIISSVSTASYMNAVLAPVSIAAGFAPGVAATTVIPESLPLPTVLADVTVRVLDTQNTERLAPLFFVSPNQINYLVPEGTQAGPATVTVTRAGGVVATGVINVMGVAPGVYSANRDGKGVAAAYTQTARAGGAQSSALIYQCQPGGSNCTAAPIDLGAEADQVFLQLFGTGIRGAAGASSVAVTIGGTNVPVAFAGAQNQYPGLDQISLRLPRTLAGKGEVDLVLTVDGQTANTVRIAFR